MIKIEINKSVVTTLDEGRVEEKRRKELLYDIIVVSIVLLFALSVRAYRLGFPPKMYFDEIYYARGAMNYLNGEEDTNWVHPPLGKLCIAAGMFLNQSLINIFSKMAIVPKIELAATWRFASLIVGSLMIPLLYFFALRLSKDRHIATVAIYLLSIEFLHFAQSRIAMLDIFLSFLMLAGFYCAYCYIDSEEKYEKYLYFAAILFGLSAACKWSGIFEALGAYIAMTLLKDTGIERKSYALSVDDQNEKKGLIKRMILKIRIKLPRAMKLAAIFIVIGIIMQLLTYIPFFLNGGTPKKLLGYYTRTLSFHYKDKWEHPYLSQMWQWPTMIRPIWYYFEESMGQVFGIIAMGSPLFWWGFLIFLIELVILAVSDRKNVQFVLLIGYFFPYIFWLISNKGGFFYYMTPCSPWMALITAYGISHWRDSRSGRIMGWIFLAVLLLFFVMFYPMLTGYPVQRPYFNRLMWSKTWI